MPSTHAAIACTKSSIRLEDDVRCLFCRFQSCHRTCLQLRIRTCYTGLPRLLLPSRQIWLLFGSHCLYHGFLQSIQISENQSTSNRDVRGLVPTMLQCPECLLPQLGDEGKVQHGDDPMVKYWLPVLHSFYEIIMTGEDLEVRRL